MSRFLLVIALAGLSYGQPLPQRGEYAVILQDPPVAQTTRTRAELATPAAQARLQAVRQAQAPVMAELKRRKVPVTYASQVLVNALFVNTTRESAAQLRGLPGVLRVQYLPPVKRDLNTALGLENVSAAWNAVGGAANAGAGVKIGIIDSGIDQNHAGFQAPSLKPPANFPKGDSGYTNNKVIVARSYIAMIAQQYDSPDDLSPRDHSGHGTAIAMIAAGVQNTGPVAAIQGVAPGAFLGNYKIFGSPGVNDFTLVSAITQALTDAVSDGMDVVTLSINEGDPAQNGPLDYDPTNCGGYCDVRTQAVETAVQSGLVVVTSAGNSNGSGVQPITLGSIHTPGTAPSAITVGSTTNSHLMLQAVHISGGTVPANLQNIHALFSDGPHVVPATAPVKDVTASGDKSLGCSALPANSLAGAIALIQRGTCLLSVKVNNAQAAGAVGVIIYQSSGLDNVYSAWGAQNTGIPAMMIGAADGADLKSYVNGNSNVTATFDPALTAVGATQNKMSAFSSRGPSIGMFSSPQVCAAGAQCPVLALKPELVAVGEGIYTATQKLDPNGDAYNASGYTGVSGTSYAVPMVAGAVAIVKQKYPSMTPAQLKSAVVNSATQDVADINSSQARITAMGAGKLSAGDAVNVAATLEPATLGFGPIAQAALPARLSLKITNASSSTASFSLAVQPRDTSSATISLSASSVLIPAGQFSTVSVTLQGTQPAAGSYEGFITITGAGATLHVPYQYQVLASTRTAYDMFPIINGSFLAGTGDNEDNNAAPFIAFRLVDQWGAPIIGTPVAFNITSGSATFGQSKDSQTFNYGIAGTDLNIGNTPGDIVVNASAGGLNYTFFGYARPHPSINNNGVVDAATGKVGQGLAPGSYITIFGNALADATQVYSTPSLPVSLSFDSVSFDAGSISLPGHFHFVSPGQINVQIPWEFQGQKSAQMTVWSSYLGSATYTVPLASYSPGFFANSGNAAVIDQTSASIVTASNPAKRGDILQLYVNGLGPVSNTPASGDPAAGGPQLSQTPQLPTVTLGGTNLPVSFAGLAPGFIGLYQVNVTIPANAPTGNQPLVITIGGVSSPSANLPVQ